MTLSEMRIKAGLKQAELAAISGVNLRSLQDYEQGHKALSSAKGDTLLRLSRALGYRIEDILADSVPDDNLALGNRLDAYYSRIMERKTKAVHFPVIESDDFVDMSRIYPTKQLMVKRVLLSLRDDNRIETLRLFGSSITMACNKDSDIDLAVEIKECSTVVRNEISEKIQVASDWGADIIWMDRLAPEERIYKDIMRGLVLI